MLDRLLAAPFALGSRLRGARVFHPRGTVVTATWRPDPGTPLPAGSPLAGEDRRALLRISHAVGLPPTLPDIVGLAVRVEDVHGPGRHQDLLFASSGTGAIGRHLLRPARTIHDALLSTLLPYEVRSLGRHVLLARFLDAPAGLDYATVATAPREHMPAVEVLVDGEPRRRLAVVEPGEPIPPGEAEHLAFHPWHTGDDLRPVGLVNRLRRPAYGASQRARGAV